MRETAAATLAAYDQNSGFYLVAANGDIWKGGYNISKLEKMLDAIKEKSGMDVTFFYGTQRVMPSLVDANGNRILGGPAGARIEQDVLKNGQEYFSKNVSADGEMYFGHYVPVFQSGDDTTPIGIFFAGVDKNQTFSDMEHVMQSVDTITSGAASQAENIKNASDNISKMGDLITETGSEAAALNSSADHMLISSDKTSATIVELKTINEKVGKAVNMIAELTEQTNESAQTIRKAANLRGTADILEKNIRNFEI